MTDLCQIFRNMGRQKDVSGVAAVQHPLGNIDSSARDIERLVNIEDAIYRTAVNSHPGPSIRDNLGGLADFQRAARRFFRTRKESQRHSVACWNSNEFAALYPITEAFRRPHDFGQFLDEFDLLFHQQF